MGQWGNTELAPHCDRLDNPVMGFKVLRREASLHGKGQSQRWWIWETLCFGKWVGIDSNDCPASSWDEGTALAESPGPLCVRTKNKKPFPDVLPIGSYVSAFSPRAVEVLQAQSVEAQFFPMAVRRHDRDEQSWHFQVVNVTRTLACLDSRSDVWNSPDGILGVNRLVIDTAKIPLSKNGSCPQWFRLAEFPYLLLVSDALKHALVEAGLTGLCLIPTESYRGVRDYSKHCLDVPGAKVPQPEWRPAEAEPQIDMVTIKAFRGSGQAALRASIAKKSHRPKKGRAIEIQWPKDASSMHLGYQQLAGVDLSCAPEFPNLRDLSCGANLLTHIDLSPLVLCEQLQELSLKMNYFEQIDLTPLAHCGSLERVDLRSNPLSTIDASPLAGLTAFEELLVDDGVDVKGIDSRRVRHSG